VEFHLSIVFRFLSLSEEAIHVGGIGNKAFGDLGNQSFVFSKQVIFQLLNFLSLKYFELSRQQSNLLHDDSLNRQSSVSRVVIFVSVLLVHTLHVLLYIKFEFRLLGRICIGVVLFEAIIDDEVWTIVVILGLDFQLHSILEDLK
jgi:presenilin-like A22 family membrane protease